jgi:hypothetical protein
MTAERYRSRYPATDDVNKLLVAPGNTVRSTPTDYATASILKGFGAQHTENAPFNRKCHDRRRPWRNVLPHVRSTTARGPRHRARAGGLFLIHDLIQASGESGEGTNAESDRAIPRFRAIPRSLERFGLASREGSVGDTIVAAVAATVGGHNRVRHRPFDRTSLARAEP